MDKGLGLKFYGYVCVGFLVCLFSLGVFFFSFIIKVVLSLGVFEFQEVVGFI